MAAKVFVLILSSITYRYNQQKALKIARRVYLVYWCLIVLLRPLALEVQQLKIHHRSHRLRRDDFWMFSLLRRIFNHSHLAWSRTMSRPSLANTPSDCWWSFFAPRRFPNQRQCMALFGQGPLCYLSPPLETSTTASVKSFWWILIPPVHKKFRVETPVYNQAKALEPKDAPQRLVVKNNARQRLASQGD